MNKTLNFVCALIASVSAVKQATDDGGEAAPIDESRNNMDQTKTSFSYEVENLDDIQTDIKKWYEITGNPFIIKHRDQVYEAAWAEAEEKYGDLLETCDEGTACREKIVGEIRENMTETWKTVIEELKLSVSTAVGATRRVINEDWSLLVECHEDHPCCPYTEIEWQNNVIKITTARKELRQHVTKWEEFEVRRIAIENRCPLINWPSCPEESNKCWDGEDRASDCSCEKLTMECPSTPCGNGAVRNLEDCSCPDVQIGFSSEAEREQPVAETVAVVPADETAAVVAVDETAAVVAVDETVAE